MRKLFAFIGAIVGLLIAVYTSSKLDGWNVFWGLFFGALGGHIIYEMIFD